MGKELDGQITYTEDGNVSVHIAARGRPNLASNDISVGTTEEWATAARGYFGYCGTFEVDEEQGSVEHIVAVSFVPNWTDQPQVRHVDLTGDELELSGLPALIAGATCTPHLLWRRHFNRACSTAGR